MTSRARPAFLRRLARLSARDWLDIAEAQIELLVAKFIVATRRTGELVSRAPLDPFGDSTPSAAPGTNVDPRPEQLALAIGRAAENGVFRPLCLVRALPSSDCSTATASTGASSRLACACTAAASPPTHGSPTTTKYWATRNGT